MAERNLPASLNTPDEPLFKTACPDIQIPDQIQLDPNATYPELLAQNVKIYNFRQALTMAAVTKATSFTQLMNLLPEIDKLIKMSRDILGYSYGAPEAKSAKANTVFPLD